MAPVHARAPQETVKQHTEKDLSKDPAPDKESADTLVIQRIGLELARELGDEASTKSIETRVVNLWKRSRKKGRAEFVKDLYEARRRTRLYQGRQPSGTTIRVKAAYFFTVLEDLA